MLVRAIISSDGPDDLKVSIYVDEAFHEWDRSWNSSCLEIVFSVGFPSSKLHFPLQIVKQEFCPKSFILFFMCASLRLFFSFVDFICWQRYQGNSVLIIIPVEL